VVRIDEGCRAGGRGAAKIEDVTATEAPHQAGGPVAAKTSRPRLRPQASGALVWVVVPLAIVALAWQPLVLAPAPGLDPSWMAALAMAVHNGIGFGDHAVFSYGPLGFLQNSTLWYSGLGMASFAYALLTRFALGMALYFGARRSFGPVLAFVFAVIVASVTYNQPSEWIVVLIVMVGAATSELSRRRVLLIATAAGAAAGIELLGKTSVGVDLTVMTAVFLISLPGRRRDYACAAVSAFVGALILGWVASGQDVGALPDYVKYSLQVISGYSAAMSTAAAGLGWQSTAAIVALGVGLWGALHTTRDSPPRQRVGVALVWIVYWFFIFKEGFVRHDSGHASIFFNAMLGGFLAFRWRPEYRPAAVACGALLLSVSLAVVAQPLSTVLDPTANVRIMVDQLRDVLGSNRRSAIIAAGRAAIKGAEPLDQRTLALLGKHTVAIYPSEIALAWAYGLNWDPIPVLQSYTAYTTGLDRLDANFLASTDSPQRILIQQPISIDGRILSFDEPLTSREMLCRFRELYATESVAVLARGANRCSAPTRLSTVHAHWGQFVTVPPPPNDHSLVFVRVSGAGPAGFERLKALLDKPAIRLVLINGRPNRLITGTANDGLPLRASAGTDFTPPFNVAVDAHTISIIEQGTIPTSGTIVYSFYAQSFDSGPAGPHRLG